MTEYGELSKTCVGVDIVKFTLFYFYRLPLCNKQTKNNERYANAFGVILLLVGGVTVSFQI